MGSNRKLEELLREFDAYEDEDLMEAIEEAYRTGQRIFGESKVQEMTAKYEMWRRGGEGFGERRGVRGTGRYAGEYRRRRR